MSTILDKKEKMQQYLQSRMPDRQNLVVVEMQRNPTLGYSYEIYLMKLAWQESRVSVTQGLVIRMEPEAGLVPPYDCRPQYELLKRLSNSGIPLPAVHWLENDPTILGRPFFVMDLIEGENFLGVWHMHPPLRNQMEKDYITLLVKLHNLDWRTLDLSFLGEPADDLDYARKQIARWEAVIQQHQHYPQPLMAELVSWAKQNMPRSERTTLCHGDYHSANCHFRDGKIVALFDWEMAGIGDPVSDLGWACLLRDIHGFWNEAEMIGEYENLSGWKVDGHTLLFWKIFAHIKLAAIFMAGIKAGINSAEPNIYMALPLVMFLPKVLDNAARLIGI